MTSPHASAAYGALMFAAGVGIPIMAAVNGQLGARIASPTLAAFLLFVVGAVVAGLALAVAGAPKPLNLAQPPYLFAGGALVAFYALSVTFAAPRIGVGNAIFFVLLGQLVSSALIDHFALLGALRSPITLRRGVGIAVIALGVFLARRPS
jgi:bacterial/archaeal transporter family-2 protein